MREPQPALIRSVLLFIYATLACAVQVGIQPILRNNEIMSRYEHYSRESISFLAAML